MSDYSDRTDEFNVFYNLGIITEKAIIDNELRKISEDFYKIIINYSDLLFSEINFLEKKIEDEIGKIFFNFELIFKKDNSGKLFDLKIFPENKILEDRISKIIIQITENEKKKNERIKKIKKYTNILRRQLR